jgi:hypothetical protein
MRSPLLTALAALVLSACGGNQPPKAAGSDPAEGGFETAETRCLAIARAPRERQRGEPERIVAKHILVKFAGARNAKPGITRSRGDACTRALEARTRLQAGEDFAAIVAEYSDEPGAATRGGTVGSIARSDVAAPFADAAFELKAGEVSHVVETDFGYHIILRTE